MATAAGIAAIVALSYACFVVIVGRLWRALDLVGPESQPLDILRGVSANFVVVAHLVKTYSLMETGFPGNFAPELGWGVELGDIGVVTFFLITGFLFFGEAFPRRQGLVAAREFLRRRWHRLAPAFLFVAAIAFALHEAYLRAHAISLSPAGHVEAAVRIFSFGTFIAPLMEQDPLLWHGINMSWTLTREWRFYFAVAVAALFGRRALLPALIVLTLFAQWWFRDKIDAMNCNFLIGGLLYRFRNSPWLALLLVVPAYANQGHDGVLAVLMFLAVSRLRSVPRLLEPMAVAGKLTYSYYLIHGLVLLLAYQLVQPWLTPNTLAGLDLYLFAILGASMAALAAVLTYWLFEMPYFAGKLPVPKAAPQAGT